MGLTTASHNQRIGISTAGWYIAVGLGLGSAVNGQ